MLPFVTFNNTTNMLSFFTNSTRYKGNYLFKIYAYNQFRNFSSVSITLRIIVAGDNSTFQTYINSKNLPSFQ